MIEKPQTAAGYSPDFVKHVMGTCLYIATKLGDLLNDIVVVGGLVPTLLIPPESIPDGAASHVGTTDLDIGLSLLLLDEQRYTELSLRFRRAGFENDVNERGNPTRQRWINKEYGFAVTVDFLIPPSREDDVGGQIRNLENDFAAVIVPGLDLAFRDKVLVPLEGITIADEKVRREIWVCGPGAFIILKAIAFRLRGERKDAYDLHFVVRHYGEGLDDILSCLEPLLESRHAQEALIILQDDFCDIDNIGPIRAAEFVGNDRNEEIRADIAGDIRMLVKAWEELQSRKRKKQ